MSEDEVDKMNRTNETDRDGYRYIIEIAKSKTGDKREI